MHRKKVKVDMNPKKVQDPSDGYKRSPGKFDQKVYMEQESFSAAAIKEMARIHAMQVHSVNHKYEKDKIEIRKKKKQLANKSTHYNYLKQLRQAFNEENDRREMLNRKMEEFARKQENPSPVREATPPPAEPEKNYKPWEIAQQPRNIPAKKEDNKQCPEKCFVQTHGGGTSNLERVQSLDSLQLPPINDKLSTPEKIKLETLSHDIMTATLPPDRLRRLLPSEEKDSSNRYPIMSTYRRNNILPEVKKFKRRMTHDTFQLHSKINQYFGTHLPLSAYIIPKSAKPHKQKLLKAISHEDFRLPQIPPELR